MRQILGWNLPPGVTPRDIEEQACGDDGLDIPDFLQISAERRAEAWREWDARRKSATVPDPVAEIRRERKRVAVEKLHVRLERAAAKRSGAMRQMPLEGRAALRAIKEKK
jgi:hypothetical protein